MTGKRTVSLTPDSVPKFIRPDPPAEKGEAWKTRAESLERELGNLMWAYTERVNQDQRMEWWKRLRDLYERRTWA